MTEVHQRYADWKLSVTGPGPDVILSVHSQVLANDSPVFAGMLAEAVDCSKPINLGPFGVMAALAALRFAYRHSTVDAAAVRILLEGQVISDVLKKGHKFDFSFYERVVGLLTPELLATVSYSACLSAAEHFFENDVAGDVRPVFRAAISTFMSYLQMAGDTDGMNSAIAELSALPVATRLAVSELLTAPSRDHPHPMFGFCDKPGYICDREIHAPHCFSFVARRGTTLSTVLNTPTFEFHDRTFYLELYTDCTDRGQPESGRKCCGLYLHTSGPAGATLKARATLRVVNLQDPGASWTENLSEYEFVAGGSGRGFANIAFTDEALLPTVWGSICVVQVVSIEVDQ